MDTNAPESSNILFDRLCEHLALRVSDTKRQQCAGMRNELNLSRDDAQRRHCHTYHYDLLN